MYLAWLRALCATASSSSGFWAQLYRAMTILYMILSLIFQPCHWNRFTLNSDRKLTSNHVKPPKRDLEWYTIPKVWTLTKKADFRWRALKRRLLGTIHMQPDSNHDLLRQCRYIHEYHEAKTYHHHSPSANIGSTSRRATWPWCPSSCWPPIQGALRPCIPWRSWRMPSSSERLYSVHFLYYYSTIDFIWRCNIFPNVIQMCLWQCFACLLIVLFCKLRPQNQKPSGSESDRIYFWNQRHDRVPSFGAVIQHWAMWNGLTLSLSLALYMFIYIFLTETHLEHNPNEKRTNLHFCRFNMPLVCGCIKTYN